MNSAPSGKKHAVLRRKLRSALAMTVSFSVAVRRTTKGRPSVQQTRTEKADHIRMDRALALLKGTSLSVEEVSAMVGYNDTSNFYRAFRGYYHVSPREYFKA